MKKKISVILWLVLSLAGIPAFAQTGQPARKVVDLKNIAAEASQKNLDKALNVFNKAAAVSGVITDAGGVISVESSPNTSGAKGVWLMSTKPLPAGTILIVYLSGSNGSTMFLEPLELYGSLQEDSWFQIIDVNSFGSFWPSGTTTVTAHVITSTGLYSHLQASIPIYMWYSRYDFYISNIEDNGDSLVIHGRFPQNGVLEVVYAYNGVTADITSRGDSEIRVKSSRVSSYGDNPYFVTVRIGNECVSAITNHRR